VAPPAAGPKLEAVEQLRFGVQIMALRALGDPDAAEEAVQETLVRAVEALRDERLRASDKLGAFVRGIARHVIADLLHARARSSPLQDAPPQKLAARDPDSLSALITEEERRRVRSALRRLSDRDREVLHLSFFEGLSPTEIGHRLEAPAPRIRKRKSRALLRLRRVLSPGPEECHEQSPPGDRGVETGEKRPTREARA